MFWLAFLAKPAIAGLIKWGIGALITYSLAKPAIEKWGSTPEKRGNGYGITQEDALEYAQKNRKEKLKHAQEKAEENNKELKEENERLKEDLKKLEQRLLRETEDWKNESNPSEKARKLVTMQSTQGEVIDKRKQVKENELTIKKNNKEVLAMYDELSVGAEKLTVEQLKVKNNRPDLGYWSTWIILTIALITAVLVVKFIFGAFKKFTREIG